MAYFRKYLPALLIILLTVYGCRKDPAIPLPLDEQIAKLPDALQILPEVTHPADNLPSPDKTRLGMLLFWDPVLSGEMDIACGSCHHPSMGYADGLDLSIGVGGVGLSTGRSETSAGRIPRVGRNAQTILNTAYNGLKNMRQDYDPNLAPMFWDSRELSLEKQSLHPIRSHNEMSGDAWHPDLAVDSVLQRLKSIPEYVELFGKAFNGGAEQVNSENLSKALACFQRSLISKNSPYDKYVAGDKDALTLSQKQGLLLFFGKANCGLCHKGPMFSDYKLTVHGVRDNPAGDFPDTGAKNEYRFRTPSLRNIELTAPYSHGGVFKTLSEALRFYNLGISENPMVSNEMLDAHIEPVMLSNSELIDLENFLKALTDQEYFREIPLKVPSGLKPGGEI